MVIGTLPLQINLLGPPEILLAGTPLAIPYLKARALLFYLAATGQLHTRDYLATLLWSETGSKEAHHSLRNSIYLLRKALRSSQKQAVLIGDGEMVGLQPGDYECDVAEFRRLLEEGQEPTLARAVGLYRGPLLQGFTLVNAPVFEEWVQGEEAHLGQACYEALDRLAALAEAREDWTAAMGFVLQMIQINPFAEMAQQRLLRIYLNQGEASLAIRQYRRFERLLGEELGVAPSPDTQALFFEALRRQRGAQTLPGASLQNPHRQPFILPFTGRESLIRQFKTISQEVQAGQGMTLLLEGEGGIGKSRLLGEFTAQLISGSPAWLVMQGTCSPFDGLLAHSPFLEALHLGTEDDLADKLGAASLRQGASADSARGQFSWRVLQTIRSMSQRVSLLLVIEDLQWANSSTLNLFGFLSTRIRGLAVMLVGTVQHAAAIPALQRLIAHGRHRGELHLIPLAPLTRVNVSALLKSSGASPNSVEALAEWLHSKSAGIPFLITEILVQMRAEGILQDSGAGWQLDIARWLQWRMHFKLPETTHDLVAWRLADLSPDARYLLDLLAMVGKPLPIAVLGEIAGFQEVSLFTIVEELSTRGLVIEPPGSTLALPHHLLRETLLQRMSNLRRRFLARQLVEALDNGGTGNQARGLPEGDEWLQHLALYGVIGEDIERARRYGLRLLTNLPREYSGAETLDFVLQLYDLLAPRASAEEMIQLTRVLGALHQSLGQLKRAAHWHQQTLDWARKAADPAAQAAASFEMGELALMTNDYQSAIRAAREGLAIIQSADLPLKTQLLIGRGHRLLGAAFAMDGSDLASAEEHLQQAVAAHRQAGKQDDLCAALFELGNIAAQRGEIPRALDFYEEAARAAESGRVHYYHALACNNYAYHSLLLGQVNNAQQSATQGVKTAETYDLLTALLHLYSTQGEIHLYLGEWGEAEELFRRGLVLAEDLGNLERQAGYRGGLALSARGRNDLTAGIQMLQDALSLIAGQGYWHLRTRLQIWLAELLFDQGRYTEMADPLDAAIATARTQDRILLLVQALRLRARFLAASGDWGAADGLFAEALENANRLELPVETARLQAAWGLAALQHSKTTDKGRALIDTARSVLAAHNARADLAILA